MSTFSDRCYYCDKPAEYNDVVEVTEFNFTVSGVCKNHVEVGLSA
jgi:hypothetical protein